MNKKIGTNPQPKGKSPGPPGQKKATDYYKHTNYIKERDELFDWIVEIQEIIIFDNFNNRSKLQRKFISLEKALYNLKKTKQEYKYATHKK